MSNALDRRCFIVSSMIPFAVMLSVFIGVAGCGHPIASIAVDLQNHITVAVDDFGVGVRCSMIQEVNLHALAVSGIAKESVPMDVLVSPVALRRVIPSQCRLVASPTMPKSSAAPVWTTMLWSSKSNAECRSSLITQTCGDLGEGRVAGRWTALIPHGDPWRRALGSGFSGACAGAVSGLHRHIIRNVECGMWRLSRVMQRGIRNLS